MKNKDIIMFGLQPWDIEIGSNFKNMADVMSRDNRVLYVNRPLDRITRWRMRKDHKTQSRLKSIRKTEKSLHKLKENLWILNPGIILESINFLPKGKLYSYLNKINSGRIANEIEKAIVVLEFKKDVLIVDNDFFNGLYLKELIKPGFFLYYLRDFLRSQTYFAKHGADSEPAIIRKADAIAANSLYLSSYAKTINPESYYVGQGCEVNEFLMKGQQLPEDMKEIPQPVIGYCGALISTRLDIDLLIHIATQLHDFNLVLVGPEDSEFKNSVLHQMTNVHFLGHKEPKELPAYVRHFDICINPQKVNQMTIGNYPRKIDEYLAAGKPTVATKTEAMMAFEDVVYLSDSAEKYVSNIRKAFEEKDNDLLISKRVEEASQHTWEASVKMIYDIFKNHNV